MATIPQLQIPQMGAVSGGADFSPLAALPQIYQKYQQDQANKAAFAAFQQTGDPKALLASGDMNLAQLGINAQNHMDMLRQQALENKRSESHWADEMKYKYKALDQADKPKYHYTTNEWGETEAYKETDNGLERVPLGKAVAEDPAAAATLPGIGGAGAAPGLPPPAARSSFPAPLPSQSAAASFPAPLPSQMPTQANPASFPAPLPSQVQGAVQGAVQGNPVQVAPPPAAPTINPSLGWGGKPVTAPPPPSVPISQSNYSPTPQAAPPLASLAPQNVPAWAQPPQALGTAVGTPQQAAAAPDGEPVPVMSGVKFDDLHKEAEFKPKPVNEQFLAQIEQRNQRIAALVKGVAEGEIDPRTLSQNHGHREFVLGLAKQYDPSFDQGNTAGRFKAKTEFLSGGPNSPASTLVTGATAIGHIYDAFQEQKKLGGTGSFGILNKPINKANETIMDWSSNPDLTRYDATIGKVAEEGTKFYRGTGGTESDIKRDITGMSAAKSPEARVANLAQSATLMMSKVAGLQDRWKNAIGEKAYNEQIAREGGNFILTQENLTKVNEMRSAAGMKPVDMRGREVSAAARAAQLKASGIRDQTELFERLHREGF